ncbi:TauD/TfdA family dioxygenase [Dongia soli]|uniref:TauD/TfdA family dioxygenase n=1 Tax=Dongia soli TaxID=600628 RepID=A0ABU5ECG3_9PROT|nr:TauD/TfdA family dioxygenase [Dongia soli]MDY0883729.1 TauD/TfdA family dioxygenase [Dongia soli]
MLNFSAPQSSDEPVDMLDLASYRTPHRIVTAELSGGSAVLRWSDGRVSQFHGIWLRDNCACPACRHPKALERRFLLIDEPGEIAVKEIFLTVYGDVEVRFAADLAGNMHLSRFSAAWLREHDYGDEARAERQHQPKLWSGISGFELPSFQYKEVMESDKGLHAWLAAWKDYGAALLRGAPAEPGEVVKIASRIGPLRPTNFGTMYDVITMPNPNASAYTAMALEPHTDLANWQSPPDCQFLFCVANEAEGGSSVLVDGFSVAEEIRRTDPETFKILSTREIEFRFQDDGCDIRRRSRMIQLGDDGRITAIRFNNWLRTAFDLPSAEVESTYQALLVLWRALRNPRFYVRPRLAAGDMFILDNYRILHGRDAFNPNTGRRHLQGCYVDRDFVLSRLRLLER